MKKAISSLLQVNGKGKFNCSFHLSDYLPFTAMGTGNETPFFISEHCWRPSSIDRHSIVDTICFSSVCALYKFFLCHKDDQLLVTERSGSQLGGVLLNLGFQLDK